MADRITFEQLRVDSRFTFLTIHKCSIHERYGEHTRAEVSGIVKGEDVKAVLSDISDEKLEIYSQNEDGSRKILFIGVIQCVSLEEEGQYAILHLNAISYTWEMDIERKSRSFQNLSLTYQDVVQAVAGEYGADVRWNIADRNLQYPLVQYQETDYGFLKRILSHLRGRITSKSSESGAEICFYVGMREGISRGAIDLKQYAHKTLPFRDGNRIDAGRKKQQVGYEIADMDYMETGDRIQIQGRDLYVMEAESVLKDNMLNCTCRVFPEECFEAEKIPADTLRGTVITGMILETGQEKVKLHLDIDKEQPVSEAYQFSWKPITGNLFYCMPETGTKAALYFDKNDENDTRVIYNVRTNGDQCGELADYNDRYFTTDHSKRMYLKPSEMGLLNMTGQNAEIAMKDASLLNMKTINQISILAEGQVELKGKDVTFTAPKEATLVRKDILSPTVINMCNAFDAIGCTGNFASTAPQVKEKKKKAAVPNQKIEKYSLNGAVNSILSNIPADDLGSPIMEAVAGSMPVISKISRIQ
ncbi:MAG: hypothetical protein HDR71_04140 [Lachnospiraceae bacterium]|nr:hypothetical protein [Lachnospiraceae bacterium]